MKKIILTVAFAILPLLTINALVTYFDDMSTDDTPALVALSTGLRLEKHFTVDLECPHLIQFRLWLPKGSRENIASDILKSDATWFLFENDTLLDSGHTLGAQMLSFESSLFEKDGYTAETFCYDKFVAQKECQYKLKITVNSIPEILEPFQPELIIRAESPIIMRKAGWRLHWKAVFGIMGSLSIASLFAMWFFIFRRKS